MTPDLLTASSLSQAEVRARFRASLAAAGVVNRVAILRAILMTVPAETAHLLVQPLDLPDADGFLRKLRATPALVIGEEVQMEVDIRDRKAASLINALKGNKLTLEQAFHRIVRSTKNVTKWLLSNDKDQTETSAPTPSQIHAVLFHRWAATHNLGAQYYLPRPNRTVSDWARDGGRMNDEFLVAVEELERETSQAVDHLRRSQVYAASPYGRVKAELGLEASMVAELLTGHAFNQIMRPPFDLFTLAWTLEPLAPSRILTPLRQTLCDMREADLVYVLPDDGELGLHHRFAGSDSFLSGVFDWLNQHEPLSAAEFNTSLRAKR